MVGPQITLALQENLLTILTYSDGYGKLVAQLVDPDLFEGDYSEIAKSAISFWQNHGGPPRGHIADLLAPILEDRANPRAETFRHILLSMAALSDSINEQFVVREVQAFVRLQKLKGAIFDAAQALQQPGEGTIEQVENVLATILAARDLVFEPGTKLSDIDSMLAYLDKRAGEFELGIPEFDRASIVPARGELLVFLAPARRGKSWFLVHVGKRALRARKKVLHITLEMSDEQVKQRYWQALHGVPQRMADVDIPQIETDERGRIVKASHVSETPEFALRSPNVRSELQKRIPLHHGLMDRLIIKRFPTRSLTVNGLCGYIDGLSLREGFTPDLVLIDYPQIMNMDVRNLRLEMGRTMEDIRGRIAIERNYAVVVVHQTGRESDDATQTKARHVSEDWSVIQTADTIITYSATRAERRFGLARLYVEKARSEAGDIGVLITQSYAIGQFALSSYYMPGNYFSYLDDTIKRVAETDTESD